MRIQNGVDIVDISRIKGLCYHYGETFLNKILTSNEKDYCIYNNEIVSSKVAKKFAAKEAFSKAIGTGIGDISFVDIEIINNLQGKPYVCLSEGIIIKIKDILNCNNFDISLSLSDDANIAIAFITLLIN